jgi:hypothetical protein
VTPEEAVAAVRKAGHIVILHKGQVFFNTTDHDEMRRWEKQGARVVSHYDLDEIERRKKKGRSTKQGWEVHLLGALQKEWIIDSDGEQIDVTPLALLNAARK